MDPQRFTLRDDRNGARITSHKYGGYVYYSDYKDLERKFQELERLARECLLGGQHDGGCWGNRESDGDCIGHRKALAKREKDLNNFLDANL